MSNDEPDLPVKRSLADEILDAIGGENLEGSGFEAETPDEGFTHE